MTTRSRLDAELVRRNLATSRAHARELLADHKVTVAGAITTNPTRMVSPAEPIVVSAPPQRFVGRGGYKLLAALENFGIDAAGQHALDVGASTGGFTDCWLQHGATSVTALDVGHNQLHERLRADDRVVVIERTNIRYVTPDDLEYAPFPLVSVDVSFISITTIAEPLLRLCGDAADLVFLVKPQFEAGRQEVSRGNGVVRGAEIWNKSLERVLDSTEALGAATMGVMKSPIVGAQGNVEFLVWLRANASNSTAENRQELVAAAVTEAEQSN